MSRLLFVCMMPAAPLFPCLAVAFLSACLVAALILFAGERGRRLQALRLAEDAQNAKAMFLGNMSHEIRTPLNGILALTEILGDSGLSPEQRELVRLVMGSAESLMHIVNDILDFSRIENGAFELESAPFDLRALIENAVSLSESHARRKNLTFECRIASDTPRAIWGDQGRLRQILLHLLGNAIKFTEAGGVTLEVAAAGDRSSGAFLLVRVIDTGIGIPPAIRATLFRPFTQGEAGHNRKYGGSGLGLAICLRLVTQMGGSIGVEDNPGPGVTFWFVIPAPPATIPAAVMPSPPPAPSMDPPPARHILIVEDNPVNQLVAARALQSLGCETEVAASGEAALDVVGQHKFDLIFMDCQMPGMDGYEVTAELRRRETDGSHVPIVAITANATRDNRERCSAAGMDDFIAKPFRVAALEAALHRWLNSRTSSARSSAA